MKYKYCILLFLMLAACDGAIESEYKEQLVVHGFIYANEPIDSVSLHYTIPYGSLTEDSLFAVTDADVRISVDGTEYVLQHGPRKGRYFLPAAEHVVQPGKYYELIIMKGPHELRARTRVPMPIRFVGLEDSLPADRIVTLDTNNTSSFAFGLTAGPVDEQGRLYILSTTGLDTIYGRVPRTDGGPPVDTASSVRYSYIQTAPNLRLYPRLFGWFGNNLITMLAMDSNWVDYKRAIGYGRRTFTFQPSLNHVTGGLGVWASAAKDTVTIFLKPQ